jgi:hypothetical protein
MHERDEVWASQVVIPFAHAGHWLADLVILAPVLGVAVWLIIVSILDKRRG